MTDVESPRVDAYVEAWAQFVAEEQQAGRPLRNTDTNWRQTLTAIRNGSAGSWSTVPEFLREIRRTAAGQRAKIGAEDSTFVPSFKGVITHLGEAWGDSYAPGCEPEELKRRPMQGGLDGRVQPDGTPYHPHQ